MDTYTQTRAFVQHRCCGRFVPNTTGSNADDHWEPPQRLAGRLNAGGDARPRGRLGKEPAAFWRLIGDREACSESP
jgi:hypothetical protein